ncbi:hypothetical protein J5N97_009713 [Dioscorea zingiberensis]|uniref:Uncharacterized protein n=1 Tax=Dioscorea zingiberensis TaxID=325984 RepID=A0A9D5CZW5_9LILI|nr:hypothetical protein J5N97_009713 [Dioscorea zingiberensis]
MNMEGAIKKKNEIEARKEIPGKLNMRRKARKGIGHGREKPSRNLHTMKITPTRGGNISPTPRVYEETPKTTTPQLEKKTRRDEWKEVRSKRSRCLSNDSQASRPERPPPQRGSPPTLRTPAGTIQYTYHVQVEKGQPVLPWDDHQKIATYELQQLVATMVTDKPDKNCNRTKKAQEIKLEKGKAPMMEMDRAPVRNRERRTKGIIIREGTEYQEP